MLNEPRMTGLRVAFLSGSRACGSGCGEVQTAQIHRLFLWGAHQDAYLQIQVVIVFPAERSEREQVSVREICMAGRKSKPGVMIVAPHGQETSTQAHCTTWCQWL